MTKRVTVSLPDHLAERLEREENASAFIAGLLDTRIDREKTEAMLAAAGIVVTPEGQARVALRLAQARAKCTPEYFAEMRRRHGFTTAP